MRVQRGAMQRELAASPPRLRFGLFSRASLFTRVVQHPLLVRPSGRAMPHNIARKKYL